MIGIIDYGMGNLRSVQKALQYLGGNAVVTAELSLLNGCERLILPGVGSFGMGMQNLIKMGMDAYVKRRVADTPLLGICLGMQFLLEESTEEGVTAGLSLVLGRCLRFTQGKVPHMGWNGVHALRSPLFSGIGEDAQFYFVHSYYADTQAAYTIAATEYGCRFASAVQAGNAYGVQFHPEKSGEVGLQLLENFMRL